MSILCNRFLFLTDTERDLNYLRTQKSTTDQFQCCQVRCQIAGLDLIVQLRSVQSFKHIQLCVCVK